MEVAVGKEAMKFAVKAALGSIVNLAKYELCLEKTVQKGLTSLRSELNFMQACIEHVSSVAQDQINPMDKLWLTRVKELSHTIETGLTSFISRIESNKGTTLGTLFLPVSKHYINHEIHTFIKENTTLAKELGDQRGRYCFDSSNTSSVQKVDSRISALYTEESKLVGLAGATDQLTKMLANCDHVSIFGMAGLGKTTLARAVYHKLENEGKFDCCAFVPVGRNADAINVLTAVLDDLRIVIYGRAPDTRQLIDQLRASLKDKRYLFIVDDIWDEETWNKIKYAFVGSDGSKIISTTRKRGVAKSVAGNGGVHEMKPLSPSKSKELLLAKIFGSEAKNHDTEDFDKLLKKCGGVPIAIITIGSLLARKQEPSKVYDSIDFGKHENEDVLKNTRTILSYSYYDLPNNLQRCFLYLSLFPEGQWVEKNMLIWRWVAEGLVSKSGEQTQGSFELGETYFHKLIDMCMIQWAVSPRDIGQGGCRVHSLMFDIIRQLSSSNDQNFSTVLGMNQETTSQTIYRLAIHGTSVDEIQNTSAPQTKKNLNSSLKVGEVLSFYATGCPGSSLPRFSKFKKLHVMDLEGCDLSVGNHKLKHLENSRDLAYIGLSGTLVPKAKLPKKIGGLKFLQTLDVTRTGIKELPSFIEKLTKLRCLRAGKGTTMMGRVGQLKSMEELWLHSADKSPDFALELQKLKELRVLVIHLDKMEEDLHKTLVKSLSVLNKLKVLQIWSNAEAEEKVRLGSWESNTPFPDLESNTPFPDLWQILLFGASLPKMPSWIRCSYVPKLSKLLLQVEILEAERLDILGQMPSLLSLYLHSEDNRLSYTAGKDEFKVLEYLNTNIELVCGDGALPGIKELEVAGIRVGTDVGLSKSNMPLLERATYHLDCTGCGVMEVLRAEMALKQAGEDHPNRPALSIKKFNNAQSELEILVMASLPSEKIDTKNKLTRTGEILDLLMGRLGSTREPPTLAAVDAGIGGSPSQCTEVSTDSLPDYTLSQMNDAADDMLIALGLDPVALGKDFEKFIGNPEVVAARTKSPHVDSHSIVKECLPFLVSGVEQFLGVSSLFTGAQTSQEGENFSRMLKELLPVVEQRIHATGSSSGQPSIQAVVARRYVRGEPLVTDEKYRQLSTYLRNLHDWYMDAAMNGQTMLVANVGNDYYFREETIHIEFSELFQLFNLDALDKSLISCYCLMKILECKSKTIFNVGFIDPDKVNSAVLETEPVETERNLLRFLKEQRQCADILFPYNFNFHWILLHIEIDRGTVQVLDPLKRDLEQFRDLQDMLQNVWTRFKRLVDGERRDVLSFKPVECARQPQGTNLCGYYICEFIRTFTSESHEHIVTMEGQIYEDTTFASSFTRLRLETLREKLLPTERLLGIQEELAEFLMSEIVSRRGRFNVNTGH